MDEPVPSARPQITVLLPCHALDDLPDWLDEHEADAVLAAWTVAWHPAVLAASAGLPDWASLDLPWTRGGRVIGLVPSGMADRFQAGASPSLEADQAFLHEHEPEQLEPALLAGCDAADADSRATADWQRQLVDDFRCLGLAVLLSERLARRMRTETSLETTGFPDAVAAAARAWHDGDEPVARERLTEAFGCLEAVRDHYYPVECWCLDLVLLAESSLAGLAEELTSPTPLGVLATPETLSQLTGQPAQLLDQLRQSIAAGSVEPVGSISPSLPPALLTPERLESELAEGRSAWQTAVGAEPAVYAQQAGPVAPLLPQLLPRLGYRGLLWTSFDGRSLPEPGTNRFQCEEARSQIEAAAPKLLDARAANAILSLPTALGDAMDHDHTVMLMFCHHAGTAGHWFRLLRRAAAWTGVFGRFVTPTGLLTETADSAAPVRFEPDAFPLRLTPDTAVATTATDDPAPLSSQAAWLTTAAEGLAARRAESISQLGGLECQPSQARAADPPVAGGQSSIRSSGWFAGWWRSRRRDDETLTLSTPGLQLRVHRGTGGIVSVRRGAAGRNLLSQQLAFRWPDTAASPATSWRPAPPAYSRMVADAIDRQGESIASRGRLVDVAGETLAGFQQTVSLVPDTAAAAVEIIVEPTAAAQALPVTEGDPLSQLLACRFAWNENDFCDLFRCLQTQLVATERQRVCSPWLLLLASEGGGLARGSRAGEAETGISRLQIFSGGLPWYVRSSPHTLDLLLATDLSQPQYRASLALGIDLPAAVDRAVNWAASGSLAPPPLPLALPSGVRLSLACRLTDPAGRAGLRLRLLESLGEPQTLRLDWGRPIDRAGCGPVADAEAGESDGVAVVGTAVEYRLRRRELVELEVWFCNDHHA